MPPLAGLYHPWKRNLGWNFCSSVWAYSVPVEPASVCLCGLMDVNTFKHEYLRNQLGIASTLRGLSCKLNIYVSWSTSELRVRLAPWNLFKPSSKIFYRPFQGGSSFVELLCFFCLVFAMPLCASVYMCLVVTCWERAALLALVCGVLLWVCHFPIGILGQVWYWFVLIPDICTLTYFIEAGIGCIRFWARLDQNSGFHGNR